MPNPPSARLACLLAGLLGAAGAACGAASHGRPGDVQLPPAGDANVVPGAPATDGNGPATTRPEDGNTDLVLPQDGNVTPAPSPDATQATALAGGPNAAWTLVGRFAPAPAPDPQGAVQFSLPNSRVGATFVGTELGLLLSGTGTDLLAVQIDGGPAVVVTTSPNAVAVAYPVAQNLAAGAHTVWLTKRTEASERAQDGSDQKTGKVVLHGLTFGPGGTPGHRPDPKARLIVALGDSSTTGYGVSELQEGDHRCVYTPQTQNAELSVPGQLATLLTAEVINVSASGKGLVQSAYDPNNTDQLAAYWHKTVPPASTPAYDFPPLAVGAVVVSVGSDDLIGDYGNGHITDEAKFVASYTDLLADMRSHYPKASLFGLVNPNAVGNDRSTLQRLIGQAVANRQATGDTDVQAFDYFAQDPNGWQSYNDADAALDLGHGCQGHASPKGSLFLAERLAAAIRLRQQW